MKPIALLSFLMLLLCACSKDSNSATPSEDTLSGQWKLVNSSGTFVGINHDFPAGLITWTFNPTAHTVTVANNNTDPNLWDMYDSGTYTYEIAESANPSVCPEILKIDGVDIGCFGSANDSLVIDQSIADGFTLVLVR